MHLATSGFFLVLVACFGLDFYFKLFSWLSVGPISPPQPPSVSAWNKPLTSFGSATSPEVRVKGRKVRLPKLFITGIGYRLSIYSGVPILKLVFVEFREVRR